MGSLLVVTGPPGAGKSTVGRALADSYERSVLVEGDAFFAFLHTGAIAPWLPESNDQNTVVTQVAAAATGRFVTGGYATVYDGIMGPWFLDEFLAGTGLDRLDCAILLPSVERCVDRVATRVDHGFADEDATRKMHAEFCAGVIDPRHVLVDPPDDVGQVVALVSAARSAGRLTYP